jgi:hypothetical protein
MVEVIGEDVEADKARVGERKSIIADSSIRKNSIKSRGCICIGRVKIICKSVDKSSRGYTSQVY